VVCVSQFTAEIESTEEAERFTQRDAWGGAKLDGQREGGLLPEEQFGALSPTVCGREEEDSERLHNASTRLPRTIPIGNPVVNAAATRPCMGPEQGGEHLVQLLGGERLGQERQLGIPVEQIRDVLYRV
jgi:hypothetical protein